MLEEVPSQLKLTLLPTESEASLSLLTTAVVLVVPVPILENARCFRGSSARRPCRSLSLLSVDEEPLEPEPLPRLHCRRGGGVLLPPCAVARTARAEVQEDRRPSIMLLGAG